MYSDRILAKIVKKMKNVALKTQTGADSLIYHPYVIF